MSHAKVILTLFALMGITSAFRFPWITKLVPDCPIDAEEIYFPHETECESYYVCSFGTITLRKCPDGLHWNQNIKICDFPDQAGCDSAITTTTEGTSTDTTTSGTTVTTENPTSTTTGSTPPDSTTEVSTPPNSTPPDSTTENSTPTTEEPSTTETTITTGGPESTTDGGISTTSKPTCENSAAAFVPHETDCDKFYGCIGGDQILFTCHDGYEFSFEEQNCVPISDTGCTASQQ